MRNLPLLASLTKSLALSRGRSARSGPLIKTRSDGGKKKKKRKRRRKLRECYCLDLILSLLCCQAESWSFCLRSPKSNTDGEGDSVRHFPSKLCTQEMVTPSAGWYLGASVYRNRPGSLSHRAVNALCQINFAKGAKLRLWKQQSVEART